MRIKWDAVKAVWPDPVAPSPWSGGVGEVQGQEMRLMELRN